MTLLSPIVLYGFEKYTLRKPEELRLRIFVRIVLRKIYGPIFNNVINRENYTIMNFILCNFNDLTDKKHHNKKTNVRRPYQLLPGGTLFCHQ